MALVHATLMKPDVMLIGPIDMASGAVNSIWVSLADCSGGTIWIYVGDPAADTSAVTLNQATDTSGTGSKTLDFDNHHQNGQRIAISGQSGTFVLNEVGTFDSTATCTIRKISSDELTVTPLTGDTTQVDAETITGDGGATATVSGTGTDEDLMVKLTTTSGTFSTLALTYKIYAITLDATMLDTENDFDHFQLALGDAGSSGTLISAKFAPNDMSVEKYPAMSLIAEQKFQ